MHSCQHLAQSITGLFCVQSKEQTDHSRLTFTQIPVPWGYDIKVLEPNETAQLDNYMQTNGGGNILPFHHHHCHGIGSNTSSDMNNAMFNQSPSEF